MSCYELRTPSRDDSTRAAGCAGYLRSFRFVEFCFRLMTPFVIQHRMRFLHWLLLMVAVTWQCSTAELLGAEYRMTNGDIIRGEAVAFDDDGLVIRRNIGGHTPRINWSRLSQESLIELAKNPQAQHFVEPFIDFPLVTKEREPKKEIILRPVPRVDRVQRPGLAAMFVAPAGIGLFLMMFLANLYAAYEIARFRNRPPALVVGLSAVLPVLGPILFLSLPRATADEELVEHPEFAGAAHGSGKITTGPMARTPMASGLSIAAVEKQTASASQTAQTYKRGEFTFNRRFFESKLPSFFRVVQSEADKDLVLIIKSSGGDYQAKRISRISSTDLHLQLLRGGEVSAAFGDIHEVQVRHKDAKA
jgi:hypothetical protein